MMDETIKTLEDIIMRDIERKSKSLYIKSHGYTDEENVYIVQKDNTEIKDNGEE